jgi:regulator of replication initiation timing
MHDPRLLYAAVEGMRPVEIEAEYRQATAGAEEENAKLRMENAELIARLTQMREQQTASQEQMARMEAQIERVGMLLSKLASE